MSSAPNQCTKIHCGYCNTECLTIEYLLAHQISRSILQVTYIVGRDSSPSLRPPPSPEGELTVWVQLELQTCMSSPFSLPTSSISLLM